MNMSSGNMIVHTQEVASRDHASGRQTLLENKLPNKEEAEESHKNLWLTMQHGLHP